MVYAGRLDEAKGLRLLMAAWDRYRGMSGDPGLRLVIAGAGPLEREVAAWASTRPSVEMVGYVPGSRCFELMSRARAVLVPSVWEEPFGLVVVEAMAAGTPADRGRARLVRRTHHPGVDGVLFRPGDPDALALAIADVEAHPEQIRDLRESGPRDLRAAIRPGAQPQAPARDLQLRDRAPGVTPDSARSETPDHKS